VHPVPPSGELIAFHSDTGDYEYEGNYFADRAIFVVRPDGSELHQLTPGRSDDTFPSWSPDGQRIAFSSNRDNDDGLPSDSDAEIWTMSLYGSDYRRLTRNDVPDTDPPWSPNGDWIAFCRRSALFL